ncbi:hypothetical protein BJ912DRAFT_1130885 [Pholiota molesta]|nr:hypothetical protein BJ912DRAFT_1130885 [Pholiota molesta]
MPGPAEVAHGPMFIGFTFNVFLFGIMVTQVYLYFTTYKNDKRWMKIFVIVLVIADTANTIFDAAYLYQSLIVHFDPAITGIIAALVQLFFAWRVRILTHSWPLAGVVLLGSLSGLGMLVLLNAGAVATSFEVGDTPRFTDFRNFKGVVIVWLVSESVTDIIITTSLVWYFDGIKRGSEGPTIWSTVSFARSHLPMRSLITPEVTVQTGLITSVVATLDLILFLIYANGTHLVFNFPLCKLYTNSLMSSLNARAGWRYGSAHGGTGTASDLLQQDSHGSAPASVADAVVMAGIGGGAPVPGTLLEQRGGARRFETRGLGLGGAVEARGNLKADVEAGGEALPRRSLSVGCTASSRQLERVEVGRGGGEMVTVPVMSSRSASGVLRGSGFGRPLSVCLSVATDTSGSEKAGDGDGASGRKVGAEELMRELDVDVGLGSDDVGRAEVVSPSRLEAGRGPFA